MNFLKYQFPVFLWMGIIFFLSSLPATAFPVIPIPEIDKAVHIVIFFLLCAVVDQAIIHQERYPGLRRYHVIISLSIVIVYGVSDEFHQSFVPSRTVDLLDVTADMVGGVIYLLLQYLRSFRRTKWYAFWK